MANNMTILSQSSDMYSMISGGVEYKGFSDFSLTTANDSSVFANLTQASLNEAVKITRSVNSQFFYKMRFVFPQTGELYGFFATLKSSSWQCSIIFHGVAGDVEIGSFLVSSGTIIEHKGLPLGSMETVTYEAVFDCVATSDVAFVSEVDIKAAQLASSKAEVNLALTPTYVNSTTDISGSANIGLNIVGTIA